MIRSFMLMALAGGITLTCGAEQPRTSDPAPRIFTAAQARAGKVAYESSCGLCHQFNMRGRTGAPGELPDVNSLPENMIKTIDQNGEQVIGKVIAMEKDFVKMDFNHPLAGKDLYFTGKVINVRAATPDEISHGHVHDGMHEH